MNSNNLNKLSGSFIFTHCGRELIYSSSNSHMLKKSRQEESKEMDSKSILEQIKNMFKNSDSDEELLSKIYELRIKLISSEYKEKYDQNILDGNLAFILRIENLIFLTNKNLMSNLIQKKIDILKSKE